MYHPPRHEAGHVVAAYAFGWSVTGATVEAGKCWSGGAWSVPPAASWPPFAEGLPFCCWPAAARASLEHEVIVFLAGMVAELMTPLAASGRVPQPAVVKSADLAASLVVPDEATREMMAADMDDPDGETDDERAARLLRSAHGDDLLSAFAHEEFLTAQARRLMAVESRRVGLVARSLEVSGSLSADALEMLLR